MTPRARAHRRCLAGAAALLVAVALAACGGGDGGGRLSDLTITRTDVSLPASLPERSEQTETAAAPTTTEQPPTTEQAPTTEETEPPATSGDQPESTRPPETVTVETTAERETVTVETTAERDTVTVVTERERDTSEGAAPTTAESGPDTAAEQSDSADDTPWAWIVLAAALVGLAVLGVVWWRRRRAAEQTWTTRMEALARRTLAALDEVTSAGSVVAGRVEALAADARTLEGQAPDASARASASAVRAGLDELARALEADRRLRLGSPPPTDEQLAYSTALIGEQVAQLRARLVPPEPIWEPPP